MTGHPTDAERIDAAVSAVLDDRLLAVPPSLAAELAAARALRTDLPLVPPGATFEDALGRRLSGSGLLPALRVQGFVRHHQRLILTGALGSALVSTASAAVLAWRLTHR